MKDQILKIAKVKSEKEFYKKYPTEEAFMAKHGKQLRKAAMGTKMVDTQLTQLTDWSNPPQAQGGFNFDDALTGSRATNLGLTKDKYISEKALGNINDEPAPKQDGMGNFLSMASDIAGDFISSEGEGEGDEMKNGGYVMIPKAQFGDFLKGIGSKIGGFAKTAGKNLMDKKQDNFISGDRGLFGHTKKADNTGFNPMDIFGKNKSTATFNTKTGMVNNASGSVSKADTDALGLSGGVPAGKGFDAAGAGMSALAAAPDIINGIGQMKEQKNAINKANQSAQISGLTAQAAESRPERIKNKYVRPEDQKFDANQLSPTYGTGSNILNAANGTEIQNMYNPGDLYMDLGYEPLNDSNVKQFVYGGHIPKAELGEYFQNSGQASIGKGVGTAIGSAFFGPIGGKVGGFLGTVGGNLLGGAKDARQLQGYQDQTEANVQRSAWAQGAQSLQAANSASMAHGGYMNPEYNPQVIARFGELTADDFYRASKEMRAGGHLKEYTPPSARAMSTERPSMEYGGQMAYGGDLKTLWGGKLKTVSHNEYLGDSVEADGNSHETSNGKGQTGIGIQYGDNVVEVENEPIQKFNNGGHSADDVVVYGNIKIPNYIAKSAGNEKLEGVSFKKAVFAMNDKEAKLNKIQEKASEYALISDDGSPVGNIGMSTAFANDLGAKLGKKIIAGEKKALADGQNAILDTAKEYGYDDAREFSEDVLKGNLKKKKDNMKSNEAKHGASIQKAQAGWHMDFEGEDPFAPVVEQAPVVDPEKYKLIKGLYDKAEKTKKGADVKEFQKKYHELFPDFARSVIGKDPLTNYAKKNKYQLSDLRGNEDSIFGKRTKQYMAALDNAPKGGGGGGNTGGLKYIPPPTTPPDEVPGSGEIPEEKTKFPWELLIDEGLNRLRPQTKNPFDYRQTLGEQYALANNQVEPVKAQLYNPMLDTPYDISLQDQLNANQSDFNAMTRQIGGNPEALASLAAQKYAANSGVLGNQFRINQANKAAIYSKNRDIMNDAQLRNLQTLDNQYVRQEQAKSNTKAQAIMALNSISAKMLQNELDTKKLNTYENLYNYRFGKDMRAMNVNGLAPINIPQNVGTDLSDPAVKAQIKELYEKSISKDKAGNVTGSKEKTSTTKKTSRNGSIVQALKRFSN
jgi:hypothetical protein